MRCVSLLSVLYKDSNKCVHSVFTFVITNVNTVKLLIFFYKQHIDKYCLQL